MATREERLLKLEHDAWLAQMKAAKNAADIDYVAMMADIEIPIEEVNNNEQPEV